MSGIVQNAPLAGRRMARVEIVSALDGASTMTGQSAASQTQQSFRFAHRSNIERYEKLLQGRLTDYERAYIERRLDEERLALTQLSASRVA